MGPLIQDKVTATDDGQPIRPFMEEAAADDRPAARRSTRILMALAAACVAFFGKSLFGEEQATGGALAKRASANDDTPDEIRPSADRTVGGSAGEAAPPAEADAATAADFNVVRLALDSLPRSNPVFDFGESLAPIKLRPSAGLNVSNDNEALYGLSTTASAVVMGSMGAGASSGGGGGGGGSDDGETGGETTDDGAGSGDGSSDDDTLENRRPTAGNVIRLTSSQVNHSVLLSIAALLGGASDADGDTLSIANLTASSGELRQFNSDQWLFTPERGDTGNVVFQYEITDGSAGVAQLALLDLVEANPEIIVGTDADDILTGSASPSVIDAMAGDDIVIGREANDIIYARDGDDRIVGGSGDDVIFAGSGNDIVFAGDGDDIVFGGSGNDIIHGEGGNDTLFGEDDDDTFVATLDDGDDVIDGGDGIDTYDARTIETTIVANLANARIVGSDIGTDRVINVENVTSGSGDDVLTGDDADNTLTAGDGDDILTGSGGADTLSGEAGNDTFVATLDDGDDVIDGGDGIDTYDASECLDSVTIDLSAGTATGLEVGDDVLCDVENAVGGSGDDTLIANEDLNVMTGGAGNDLFVFTAEFSGRGRGSRDVITDFEVGDRIDIRSVSREAAEALEDFGFRRFVLISEGEDFTEPGQVRFRYETLEDRDRTIIEGNIDDDLTEHEFEIELLGRYALRDDDFEYNQDRPGQA